MQHEGYRCLPDKLRELKAAIEQANSNHPTDQSHLLETYASWAETLLRDLDQNYAGIEKLGKEKKELNAEIETQRRVLDSIELLIDLNNQRIDQ